MLGVLIEFRYGVENRQAPARRAFPVVVVGLGAAKKCHHAVAKVLGNLPSEALDGLCRRTMVLANDLPPLFRVELAAIWSSRQVAKKHRQMAALASGNFV